MAYRISSLVLAGLVSVGCSETSGGGSGGGGAGGGGGAPSCDASAVDGIQVTANDAYAFPSYAIDGCRLAYVAASGDLLVRDLSTGRDERVVDASESPRRPSMQGGTLAWEATEKSASAVRVRLGSGAPRTLTGSFDHAGEPRAASDAVVFTAWLGPDDLGDCDVMLYDVTAGSLSAVGTGPAQQRFADVSTTHVAYTDFSEDPDGTFNDDGHDLADIVLYDRTTKTQTAQKRPGKQAFPMLGASGKLTFLDWNAIHPEPKFSAYQVFVGDLGGQASDVLLADVENLSEFIRPTASGALVDWVNQKVTSSPALWRRPADLSQQATEVASIPNVAFVGPASSPTITVVATVDAHGTVALRGFAR
jgi:hypothetical protein